MSTKYSIRAPMAALTVRTGSLGSVVAFFTRVTALDRAVVFSGLGTLAAAGLGATNAVLVANTFSPTSQGFFYTFGSLVTLYVFLELGLGQTVIQFASHERALLASDSAGRVIGPAPARLANLFMIAVVWYAVCSLVILAVIGPAGYAFFARRGADVPVWVGPWLLLCVGAAASVLLTPVFLFVQVCEEAAVFWFFRLVYQLVYGLGLSLSILVGAELWAVGVATWLGVFWSAVYVGRHAPRVKELFSAAVSGWVFWYREVWPVQWKVATTGISSYFVTPLLVVVAFHYGDPVLAGQVGMSGTANIIVLAIASSWIVTRAPRLAALVAQARGHQLDRLFARACRVTLVVALVGGIGLWMTSYLLKLVEHPLSVRLVDPLAMGLIVIATVLQSVVVSVVTYMRAHKEEPLGLVCLLTVAITVLGAAALAPARGAVGIAIAHLTAVSVIQMPAAVWYLARLRRQRARDWALGLAIAE